MESGFLTISIFTFCSVETFIESENMNNISCFKLLNTFFFLKIYVGKFDRWAVINAGFEPRNAGPALLRS